MAHISKIILFMCVIAGLGACVGPDEVGMSSTTSAPVTTAQSLSLSPTFKLSGLELLPADLHLLDVEFARVEIVLTSLDGDAEDVVVPVDLMAFYAEDSDSSARPDLRIMLPGQGRYSVRMQTSATEDEDSEDLPGLRFKGLIAPGAQSPFDSRLADGDEGDGPNPHPFDGGGSAPSKPGSGGDPVASGDEGDGPNPHPFDEGDDGTPPSSPGGNGGDTDDSDRSAWSVLAYQSDESMHLHMGEINVTSDDQSITISINLPSITATAHSIVVQPSVHNKASGTRSSATPTHQNASTHQPVPEATRHTIHEDARHMNNRGRHYY